jgi:hypothetical protein
MKLFPNGVSAEQVRADLLGWIDLLSAGRYADAVDFLSPEIPDQSGSTDETRWTPELLESVISNYGLDEPIEGEDWRYRVAPLTNELLPTFDERLDIDLDFGMWEGSTADGSRLAGAIHADMPLVYEDGPAMSDLTARFMFKHFADGRMALVLLDIHVL